MKLLLEIIAILFIGYVIGFLHGSASSYKQDYLSAVKTSEMWEQKAAEFLEEAEGASAAVEDIRKDKCRN